MLVTVYFVGCYSRKAYVFSPRWSVTHIPKANDLLPRMHQG